MLTHPATGRLREMGLAGMARALEEQRRQPHNAGPGFEDRLAMSGEPLGSTPVGQALGRGTKRLAARLRFAGLRQQATPEGIGHRAGRDNRPVLHQRVPRRLEALGLARGDGRYARHAEEPGPRAVADPGANPWLRQDNWAMTPLNPEQRRGLMEVVDGRHGRASTLVARQAPVEFWHGRIGHPTIADAVLDRLAHRAYRLGLKGERRRKLPAGKARLDGAAAS